MHPCKCCGKSIHNPLCTSKGKRRPHPKSFCTLKCQNDYYRDKSILAWKEGRFDGLRGEQLQLSKIIRDYILLKHKYRCNKCGWSKRHPHSGRTTVQVHHIDGNALNNKESNLEVLCPNCHSLTPNFGKYNRLGRTERSKDLVKRPSRKGQRVH